MGNAGRNGGEYYTPHSLIRSMIDVLEPKIGKTSPLNEDDLAEFRKLFKKKADSANSWTVNIADLDPETLDLTVRNPNAKEEKITRSPKEIAAEMAKLDKSNAALLADILKVLG